uniref:Kinesin-like protein n=1 Tax=Petromyzon marinus TaxID=7757 RepID=S4RVC2_PETMA
TKMTENIKVAVRVRPFNEREKTRGASIIISMEGNTTRIIKPRSGDADVKTFTFDYSYWSHDGFVALDNGYLAPENEQFADQKRVFSDLGEGILENAWNGYNCSLFAYGQTGSGKTYSVVGGSANKGILPLFCERLFEDIERKQESAAEGTEFQVSLSMVEIYNEQVRDLLNPQSGRQGGLRIREKVDHGFFVENLLTVPVGSYGDIDSRIQEGTRNRTIAATHMNATSSRAHTIVAITFVQKAMSDGGHTLQKSSTINIVDLAGSERAGNTGAARERLKEGCMINQSLSTLGNVIKALADQGKGVQKSTVLPFRDSVLTKLLKNALGGNSKTIMIAALSPADVNYEETLSTLRFVDRAKAIRVQAVVNESPTSRLVRELQQENMRLQELLSQASYGALSNHSWNPCASSWEQNRREMEHMAMSWEQRLASERLAHQQKLKEEKELREKRKTIPHLWNLNEDPALNGLLCHFIPEGSLSIGNGKSENPAGIILHGVGVLPHHASVNNKDGVIILAPSPEARVLINGCPLTQPALLNHNDRLLLGASQLYVLYDPKAVSVDSGGDHKQTVTFDKAQEEIACNSGLCMAVGGNSSDDALIWEDLLSLLPALWEGNGIGEELGKGTRFEVVLTASEGHGKHAGLTQVRVKMTHLASGLEFLLRPREFLGRRFLMQEMYQRYLQGDDWDLPRDKDPFWECPESTVSVGVVQVALQPLSHQLAVSETYPVLDCHGQKQGHLRVLIQPCDSDGAPKRQQVGDPNELIGKQLHLLIRILGARGIPEHFTKTHCRFKLFCEDEDETAEVASSNPDYNFEKTFFFNPVTEEFLDYIAKSVLTIEVCGTQVER